MENVIINFINKHFNRPITLLAGILVIALIFAPLDSFFDNLITNPNLRFIIYGIIALLWTGYWLSANYLWPRSPKNKVGIVICISTENDKQKIRIKNDFVKRLNELLIHNNLADQINLLLIPSNKTERLLSISQKYARERASLMSKGIDYLENPSRDIVRWSNVRKRIRGNFFILGTIKERMESDNRYFLELDSIVTHAPLNPAKESIIKKELMNIWSKKISFKEQFEFKGFLFSADYIYFGVKYITGIAAFFSGDPFLAVKLHCNLESEISNYKPLPPNLKSIRYKLRELLSEEYLSIARWHEFNGNDKETKEFLSKAEKVKPDSYNIYIFKSVKQFREGKIDESLASLRKARKYARNDGTWRYNEAFILMFQEKWEEAQKTYKRISESSYPSENTTLSEVIDFNEKYYEENPEFLQSLYVLGYLNYRKVINYPLALQHFESFIAKASEIPKFEYLVQRANSYKNDLDNRMKLK